MKRSATFLIALTILVTSGLAHGLWAERWTSSTVLQEAAARVYSVPMEVGTWKAQALDSDPAAFSQIQAQSYWTRTYVSEANAPLLAILMCGRSGRMAVHTPEVCYRGAGYEMIGEPEILAVRGEEGNALGAFWSARFAKKGMASPIRLYWAWNAGTGWQASSNPRWRFGGESYLYKFYLVEEEAAVADPAAGPAAAFLREFVPAMECAFKSVKDSTECHP